MGKKSLYLKGIVCLGLLMFATSGCPGTGLLEDDRWEPDNSKEQARWLGHQNEGQLHTFTNLQDEDWYAFVENDPNASITIIVTSEGIIWPAADVYDNAGNLVDSTQAERPLVTGESIQLVLNLAGHISPNQINLFFLRCYQIAMEGSTKEDPIDINGTSYTVEVKRAPPSTNGSIFGQVNEMGGGGIDKANVALTELGSTSTSTQTDGAYVLPHVPDGTYTLQVSKTGYKTESKLATVQSNATVNFDLQKEGGTNPIGPGGCGKDAAIPTALALTGIMLTGRAFAARKRG